MSLGGLFIHRAHTGGRAFAMARARAAQKKHGPSFDSEKLDAFADALAEHGTVAAAARAVGISHQRGSQLLARIKGRLGWQSQ